MNATFQEPQFTKSYDAVSFTTQYKSEASDLGLKPGEFPRIVQIERADDKPLVMHLHGIDRNRDGDVVLHSYSPLGTVANLRFALTIFND